jgi:hypothetical protein
MDIRTALIAHPQATMLRQPRQSALHHPALDTQTATVPCPTFGQYRGAAQGIPLAAVKRCGLLPGLRRAVGVGPGLFPRRPQRGRYGYRPAHETRRSCLPPGAWQSQRMEWVPHPAVVPVMQTPPARHARATAPLLGAQLPRDSGLQHKEDAGQRLSLGDPWPTPCGGGERKRE